MAKPKLRFLYFGMRVRDLERSIKFYQSLGMVIRTRGKMSHGGEYVHLSMPRSPVRLELNYYPEGNRFYTPYGPESQFDHLGFYSEDPDGALRTMVRAGGTTLIPTWDEPTSRIGYVDDPDGLTLEVFGPLPRSKRPRRRS